MRWAWLSCALALITACWPVAGGIDGDRFPCANDDDCGGDGFTCVAGICRDPRDLTSPDASAADAGLEDTGASDGQAGIDARADAGRDGGEGQDASPADATTYDAADGGAPDSSFDASEPDAARWDSGGTLCTEDPSCTSEGSFCYSGRCVRLVTETIPTLASRVEAPSLMLRADGSPVIAYFDSINNDAHMVVRDSLGTWADLVAETTDTVGLEPQVAADADDRAWALYRHAEDSTLHLAVKEGAGISSGEAATPGITVVDRGGFAIDASGRQHILAATATLQYGSRVPSEPPASRMEPPFVMRSAWGSAGARWPALFFDRSSGLIYGTFAADLRPHIGLVDPVLGFVSAYAVPRTISGCSELDLGEGSDACNADQPIDLALDPQGRAHLCTHMRTTSSQYRLTYLRDNGARFVGTAFDAKTAPNPPETGARCALVVDDHGAAHVFYARTDTGGSGRALMRMRFEPEPADTATSSSVELELHVEGIGYWPDAQLDSSGRPHMTFVRATGPVGRNFSTAISESELVYGWLEGVVE